MAILLINILVILHLLYIFTKDASVIDLTAVQLNGVLLQSKIHVSL